MKIIKNMFTLLLIGCIGIALITTRPSGKEFADWYVEHNKTGLGGFFDAAYSVTVEKRTKTNNYLLFSVFELDERERYVGVLGHFFGKNTVEQTQETLRQILEQAGETITQKGEGSS